MRKTITKLHALLPFFLVPTVFWLLLGLPGCDKFEGDQTVPAYLRIDSIGFTTDYVTQGTRDQKLVDVWVYVDDDLVGGFELPATIPVLAEGRQKLELRPGIMLNGISDTRAPYPCIQPMIFEDFELIPDSAVEVYGVTDYYGNSEFRWMEDFEDASLAIHETTKSDTTINRTYPSGNPDAYINGESQFSGICYLDDGHDFMELVSDDGNGQGFVFDRGDFVFMEIHYKIDLPVLIGLYIKKFDGTIQDRSFLVLNDSDTWKKIYVNFTPIVNETVDAEDFKIYFQTQLPEGDNSAVILLDNLKLITRPNL